MTAMVLSWIAAGITWLGLLGLFAISRGVARGLRDYSSLYLYLETCASRTKSSEAYDEIVLQAGHLYQYLQPSGEARARYIATTALAWFYKRDSSNYEEVRNFREARNEVETHLRQPLEPWEVPTKGVVFEFANGIRPALKDANWLTT